MSFRAPNRPNNSSNSSNKRGEFLPVGSVRSALDLLADEPAPKDTGNLRLVSPGVYCWRFETPDVSRVNQGAPTKTDFSAKVIDFLRDNSSTAVVSFATLLLTQSALDVQGSSSQTANGWVFEFFLENKLLGRATEQRKDLAKQGAMRQLVVSMVRLVDTKILSNCFKTAFGTEPWSQIFIEGPPVKKVSVGVGYIHTDMDELTGSVLTYQFISKLTDHDVPFPVYKMLARALRHSAKPRIVVVDDHVFAVAASPKLSLSISYQVDLSGLIMLSGDVELNPGPFDLVPFTLSTVPEPTGQVHCELDSELCDFLGGSPGPITAQAVSESMKVLPDSQLEDSPAFADNLLTSMLDSSKLEDVEGFMVDLSVAAVIYSYNVQVKNFFSALRFELDTQNVEKSTGSSLPPTTTRKSGSVSSERKRKSFFDNKIRQSQGKKAHTEVKKEQSFVVHPELDAALSILCSPAEDLEDTFVMLNEETTSGSVFARIARRKRCSESDNFWGKVLLHFKELFDSYCSRAHAPSKVRALFSFFNSQAFSGLTVDGWIKDLTRECIEANPGPVKQISNYDELRSADSVEEFLASEGPTDPINLGQYIRPVSTSLGGNPSLNAGVMLPHTTNWFSPANNQTVNAVPTADSFVGQLWQMVQVESAANVYNTLPTVNMSHVVEVQVGLDHVRKANASATVATMLQKYNDDMSAFAPRRNGIASNGLELGSLATITLQGNGHSFDAQNWGLKWLLMYQIACQRSAALNSVGEALIHNISFDGDHGALFTPQMMAGLPTLWFGTQAQLAGTPYDNTLGGANLSPFMQRESAFYVCDNYDFATSLVADDAIIALPASFFRSNTPVANAVNLNILLMMLFDWPTALYGARVWTHGFGVNPSRCNILSSAVTTVVRGGFSTVAIVLPRKPGTLPAATAQNLLDQCFGSDAFNLGDVSVLGAVNRVPFNVWRVQNYPTVQNLEDFRQLFDSNLFSLTTAIVEAFDVFCLASFRVPTPTVANRGNANQYPVRDTNGGWIPADLSITMNLALCELEARVPFSNPQVFLNGSGPNMCVKSSDLGALRLALMGACPNLRNGETLPASFNPSNFLYLVHQRSAQLATACAIPYQYYPVTMDVIAAAVDPNNANVAFYSSNFPEILTFVQNLFVRIEGPGVQRSWRGLVLRAHTKAHRHLPQVTNWDDKPVFFYDYLIRVTPAALKIYSTGGLYRHFVPVYDPMTMALVSKHLPVGYAPVSTSVYADGSVYRRLAIDLKLPVSVRDVGGITRWFADAHPAKIVTSDYSDVTLANSEWSRRFRDFYLSTVLRKNANWPVVNAQNAGALIVGGAGFFTFGWGHDQRAVILYEPTRFTDALVWMPLLICSNNNTRDSICLDRPDYISHHNAIGSFAPFFEPVSFVLPMSTSSVNANLARSFARVSLNSGPAVVAPVTNGALNPNL